LVRVGVVMRSPRGEVTGRMLEEWVSPPDPVRDRRSRPCGAAWNSCTSGAPERASVNPHPGKLLRAPERGSCWANCRAVVTLLFGLHPLTPLRSGEGTQPLPGY